MYNAPSSPKPTERGQAIIIIVFAIIGMIGLTALAVDGGNAFLEQRNAQAAADSIAMDAALARVKNPQGSLWMYDALSVAERTGYSPDNPDRHIQINSPPASGEYMNNPEYIQVIITSYVDTYFAGVVGINRIRVVSEAISRTKSSIKTQILGGRALIALAPTSDCDNQRSFWVHGESTIALYGGGLFVNSNNPDCALIQNGNGSVRVEEGWGIEVVGGLNIQKARLFTPQPVTGIAPIGYPPPLFLPKLGCSQPATVYPDGKTISAGAWSGDFPPPGVQVMESGVYCIDGNFIVSNGAPLEGQGVIIQVENGSVQFDGNPQVNLKAASSGDYAGLLFYVPIDNKTRVTINLGAGSEFQGTVLAPSSEIRINTDRSENGFHSQIIGYTFQSNGQSLIRIRYNDEQNLDLYTMPSIELIK